MKTKVYSQESLSPHNSSGKERKEKRKRGRRERKVEGREQGEKKNALVSLSNSSTKIERRGKWEEEEGRMGGRH